MQIKLNQDMNLHSSLPTCKTIQKPEPCLPLFKLCSWSATGNLTIADRSAHLRIQFVLCLTAEVSPASHLKTTRQISFCTTEKARLDLKSISTGNGKWEGQRRIHFFSSIGKAVKMIEEKTSSSICRKALSLGANKIMMLLQISI